MALVKPRRRFILVQSTSNANVTEDNMEPYHVSVFRRSTSMPPLPKVRSTRHQSTSNEVQPVVQVQEDVSNKKKSRKFNFETMRRKSARIGIRISNVFGLSAHTVDEQFNFEEHRFRAIEKFLHLFLRQTNHAIEIFREIVATQVQIAGDFQELLNDQKQPVLDDFIQSGRLIFVDFCTKMETFVLNPVTVLIKCYVSPSNLISKRNKRLLDYDSAYSTYEKIKDQQLKQTKQLLDYSKRTYEQLNNQLLEDLPLLYQYSCDVLSICLPLAIVNFASLIQQIRAHLSINQQISSNSNWQDLVQRLIDETIVRSEQLFQLRITRKHFLDRSRVPLASNINRNDDNNERQRKFTVEHRVESIDVQSAQPPPVPIRRDLLHLNQKSDSTPDENHKPIYVNQTDIEPDQSSNERIFVALYDFQSTLNGVLSLEFGERLKVLRQVDDDQNDEWWYVEKIKDSKQRGYVPANYIEAEILSH